MLNIDASNGGGSIVRIAVPFAITKKIKIKINNIRINRPKPGLRYQHLVAIQSLCKITDSNLIGGFIGSKNIVIEPGTNCIETDSIKLETAAAISLVYQLFSNYNIMSKNKIKIHFQGGGTHTNWSPNIDYIQNLTIPSLEIFGQYSNFEINQYGFFPKGGAEGVFTIENRSNNDIIQFDQTNVTPSLKLIALISKSLKTKNVGERIINEFSKYLDLGEIKYSDFSYAINYVTTLNPGASITAIQYNKNNYSHGYSVIGSPKITSENMGMQLYNLIKDNTTNVSLDKFLVDQLLVALVNSKFNSYIISQKLTNHIDSNLKIINKLYHQYDRELKIMKIDNGKYKIYSSQIL